MTKPVGPPKRRIINLITFFVVMGFCAVYYAWSVPIVFSWCEGSWVIGGRYHAHTGMYIFFAVLIPWFIEACCFMYICDTICWRESRDWDASREQRRHFVILNRWLALALVVGFKFGPYAILKCLGVSAFLVPIGPEGEMTGPGFLYLVMFGITSILFLFKGPDGVRDMVDSIMENLESSTKGR